MKKKILGLMFVLFILSFMPVVASAATGGNCGMNGANVTWTLDNEGTLTISGEGYMRDYVYDSYIPWYDNRSNIKKIVIEQGITYIGMYAFSECNNLTSVTIPSSIAFIGGAAFYECENLKDVHIADIAKWCEINFDDSTANPFYYAENMYINDILTTNLVIPNGVTRIRKFVFSDCNSLTSVTIPDSVTNIDILAFFECDSLNINVNENNTSYCDINGILFNKNKSEIIAYSKDKIQPNYTIPNSVTSIGKHAFHGCSSLTNITIPNSVTSIGEDAFSECSSLTNITIPDSVTNIDVAAFWNCNGLTNITIPNSITNIGYGAFYGCSSLTSVTIPDSVTSIGDKAFSLCGSLKSIEIPDSVTKISCELFSGCVNLYDIKIGSNITEIDRDAFSETAYDNDKNNWQKGVLYLDNYIIGVNPYELPKNYTIRDGTALICYGGFSYCPNLESITIPDSITAINLFTFQNCEKLSDVFYSGTKKDWDKITISIENDSLLNANIHYMGDEPIDIIKPKINISQINNQWRFEMLGVKYQAYGKVYYVIYNKNNMIIELKESDLDVSGRTVATIDKVDGAAYARVFSWTDLMRPITYVEEVSLENVSDYRMVLTDKMKSDFEKYCYKIPPFTQSTLTSESFARNFIFHYFNGKVCSESEVRNRFKTLFGAEMAQYHPTDDNMITYNQGYYNVNGSDWGDVSFIFNSAKEIGNGLNITYDYYEGGTKFWEKTFSISYADNENGYIITSVSGQE